MSETIIVVSLNEIPQEILEIIISYMDYSTIVVALRVSKFCKKRFVGSIGMRSLSFIEETKLHLKFFKQIIGHGSDSLFEYIMNNYSTQDRKLLLEHSDQIIYFDSNGLFQHATNEYNTQYHKLLFEHAMYYNILWQREHIANLRKRLVSIVESNRKIDVQIVHPTMRSGLKKFILWLHKKGFLSVEFVD